MTRKAEFNAEEWSDIAAGPPLAGMIVITAQHGGTIRESVSMSKAYAEAKEAHMGPELIEDLLASPPEIDPHGYGYKSVDELQTGGIQQLTEIVATLKGKATADEVDAYRGFVLGVAERAAHAHKTGGFLGFGGHVLSDAEPAALDQIRDAMGAHAVPDSE